LKGLTTGRRPFGWSRQEETQTRLRGREEGGSVGQEAGGISSKVIEEKEESLLARRLQESVERMLLGEQEIGHFFFMEVEQ